MLEDSLRLVFGEGWEEKRQGCVYAEHFMGEPSILFDLDKQALVIIFANNMELFYSPSIFGIDPSTGKVNSDALLHLAVQREMHEIYLDELKRRELAKVNLNLADMVRFTNMREEELGPYTAGDNIVKAFVRGSTWLGYLAKTRMPKTLAGYIREAKSETEEYILLYRIMIGFVGYGKELFGSQLEKLDGQLGSEGKGLLSECCCLAGQIGSIYSTMIRAEQSTLKEMERLERLLM